MTTSISLRILLSGILRENCELPPILPARIFREKCRKREITGEKRRFHSHVCDRPNYVSSQPRYDHFDTLPYLSQHQHLRKRGELMGRTSKNIKFRIPETPRKIKGFRNGGFPIATTISNPDPSTTWVHLHISLPQNRQPDEARWDYQDIISHPMRICKAFL